MFVLVALLPLVLGEEAAVGVAGAAVLELEDAADLGLEVLAGLVEQGRDGGVGGGLVGGLADGVDAEHVLEVGFERVDGHGGCSSARRPESETGAPGLRPHCGGGERDVKAVGLASPSFT